MQSQSSKSDKLKEIQLKSQMESLKIQRQKSLQRNQMIRRQMQEFEANLSSVSAKTQALRTMKNDYEEYIERLYPRWKEQVMARASEQRDKEARLSMLRRDVGLTDDLAVPQFSHPPPVPSSHFVSPAHVRFRRQNSDFHLLKSLRSETSRIITKTISPATPSLKLSAGGDSSPIRDTTAILSSATSHPDQSTELHLSAATSQPGQSTEFPLSITQPVSALSAITDTSCPCIRCRVLPKPYSVDYGSADGELSTFAETDMSPTESLPIIKLRPLKLLKISDQFTMSNFVQPKYTRNNIHSPSSPLQRIENPAQFGSYQENPVPIVDRFVQSPRVQLNGETYRQQVYADHPLLGEQVAPQRSSSPDFDSSDLRPRHDRGFVSTSMQSMISEKSVTFDESSLRQPLTSATSNQGFINGRSPPTEYRTTRDEYHQQQRRSTPSPSELIRMSMRPGDSPRSQGNPQRGHNGTMQSSPPSAPTHFHSDESSTLFTHLQPSQSSSALPPHQSTPHTMKAPTALHYQSTNNNGHYHQNDAQLSAYGNGNTSPTRTQPVTTVPSAVNVSSSPAHGVSNSHSTSQLPPQGRRSSGPQVVIPSAEDVTDDLDSLADSAAVHAEDNIDSRLTPAPHHTSSPSHKASAPAAVGDVNHSFSSLNTTTEEPGAVDVTKTAEFKNLLTGTLASTQDNYGDSDDSEDSMDAVEQAYKQLALNKTNTMALGHDLMTVQTMNEPVRTMNDPSPDEDQSDDDSLSAPMGYTPSFASNMKSQNNDSTKPISEASTKVAQTLPTSTVGSSTGGGSKNSSGSRKAFQRADSDVESDSDLQSLPNPANQGSAGKTSAPGDDLDDDFDFYGWQIHL